MTPENAKTQSWVTETAWQRIVGSTGPQQQNTDDHNCPIDTAERSSSADVRSFEMSQVGYSTTSMDHARGCKLSVPRVSHSTFKAKLFSVAGSYR